MTALDAERLAQGVRNTLAAITPRLKDFHQLLIEPPKVSESSFNIKLSSSFTRKAIGNAEV